MRIVTYNVNGIRAAMTKGFLDWLRQTNPDVLCLQETKAQPEQLNPIVLKELGYNAYWFSAQKKGYSGVAILSKKEPKNVVFGCGIKKHDFEGRIIRADFDNISVVSAYFPSGSSGDDRQKYKMEFLYDMEDYFGELIKKIPKLVISGDYNICHKAIDIHNPIANANTSGFLPEEREWLSKFLNIGLTDSFRFYNPNPHEYSWWSYRANARQKNLGWRIDYNLITKELEKNILRSVMLKDALHSDHCPVLLDLK